VPSDRLSDVAFSIHIYILGNSGTKLRAVLPNIVIDGEASHSSCTGYRTRQRYPMACTDEQVPIQNPGNRQHKPIAAAGDVRRECRVPILITCRSRVTATHRSRAGQEVYWHKHALRPGLQRRLNSISCVRACQDGAAYGCASFWLRCISWCPGWLETGPLAISFPTFERAIPLVDRSKLNDHLLLHPRLLTTTTIVSPASQLIHRAASTALICVKFFAHSPSRAFLAYLHSCAEPQATRNKPPPSAARPTAT
jgi:hypothetical protein